MKNLFAIKGGSRHLDKLMYGESFYCLNKVFQYFSNYYTLHRSDLPGRAAPLDLRLAIMFVKANKLST